MRLPSGSPALSENRSGRFVSVATPFWVGPRQLAQSEPRPSAAQTSARSVARGRKRFMDRLSLVKAGGAGSAARRQAVLAVPRRRLESPRTPGGRFPDDALRLHLEPGQA